MTPSLNYFWCFFFSSRRRHTRFDCDWSSDVCSSDLNYVDEVPVGRCCFDKSMILGRVLAHEGPYVRIAVSDHSCNDVCTVNAGEQVEACSEEISRRRQYIIQNQMRPLEAKLEDRKQATKNCRPY